MEHQQLFRPGAEMKHEAKGKFVWSREVRDNYLPREAKAEKKPTILLLFGWFAYIIILFHSQQSRYRQRDMWPLRYPQGQGRIHAIKPGSPA